ncbi:MFS transporter [Alteromonas sp. 14N.309.X.WAT.G.H12]|uniref:MFS transporter n=1 Tax=Alteromonas sp. 14N.309.X.WAT.G.H12 TaxID=3120824 RepID=UPI002FD44C42
MPQKFHSVYYCAIVVSFGAFILGLDAALISGTIKFVSADFSLSDMQIGMMVSAPGLAVLFALMFTGYICNRIGRKKTLIGISFIYIFSAIASTFAPNYETLVIARFVGGLAFTSLSVAAMYIGEIAPPALRGRLVAMVQISIVVGFSAAYFINYGLLQLSQSSAQWVVAVGLNENTWRWMLGVEIIPALVWFSLLFTIPKSPRWLVLRGHVNEAKEVLHAFGKGDKVDEELVQIQDSLKGIDENASFFKSFKYLFEKRVRMAVVIAFIFGVVQQVTGINAILFYAPTVFEQLGVGTDAAFLNAVVVGVTGMVFTVLGILLIDRAGRRPLAIWGLAWVTVSLFICYYGFDQATYSLSADFVAQLAREHQVNGLEGLVGQVFNSDFEFKAALINVLGEGTFRQLEGDILQSAATIPVAIIMTGIISFIMAFHMTIGPVLWVLFSELFPTHVRGIAIPTFAFISSMVSYFVQQFFPWLLTNLGASQIFLFYGISGLIGYLLMFKFMPETKNKTIEEIELMLNKGAA